MGITVPMAIYDFIPVVFFFSAAMVVAKDVRNKMGKVNFAVLITGSVLVLLAGFCKALWKIIFALTAKDIDILQRYFFVVQSAGFMLVFIALLLLLVFKGKTKVTGASALAVAAPVAKKGINNVPFIALQCIGCAGVQFCLFRIALFMKKRLAAVLFIFAFIFMLGMGYLGAKFDDSSSMHWIAQFTNSLSTGCLLAGVLILHANGLGDADVLEKR